MAGGLDLYSGPGAKDIYRAHLGHEQLTATVDTLLGNNLQGHINGLSRVDILAVHTRFIGCGIGILGGVEITR